MTKSIIFGTKNRSHKTNNNCTNSKQATVTELGSRSNYPRYPHLYPSFRSRSVRSASATGRRRFRYALALPRIADLPIGFRSRRARQLAVTARQSRNQQVLFSISGTSEFRIDLQSGEITTIVDLIHGPEQRSITLSGFHPYSNQTVTGAVTVNIQGKNCVNPGAIPAFDMHR